MFCGINRAIEDLYSKVKSGQALICKTKVHHAFSDWDTLVYRQSPCFDYITPYKHTHRAISASLDPMRCIFT